MNQEDYAVSVLLVTPGGIPLVRDHKKPEPLFWKLPGGRSNPGETAENCALRELSEETGIKVPPKNLRAIYKEKRGGHTFVLFRADLKDSVNPFSGEDGEEVAVFKSGEILSLPDFFPPHREVLKDILI